LKAKLFPAIAIMLVMIGCSKIQEHSDILSLDQKFNEGKYEQVIEAGEKHVQQFPNSYKGWNLLGWAYFKTDHLEKAKACFDQSIEVNPKSDNAHVGLGALHRKNNRLDLARQSYHTAISIEPENPEAFASLLVIELMEGNDEKAVEYGEKAWAMRKDSPVIAANLSVAYHYLGDHEKRDSYYKHAEKLGYLNLQILQEIYQGTRSLR
jgi:tetratricopeptide (TPR) repeat protein